MNMIRARHLACFLAALGVAGLLSACGGSDSPAGGSAATLFKSVMLAGAQESPAVTTAAVGQGLLVVNPDTGEMSGSVNTFGITATAAHVHTGAVGVNGASIVDLAQSSPGIWSVPSGTMLTSAQVDALRAGTLYVNIVSAAHPAGEIRGQVGRLVYFATLTGTQEVPPTGSANTGTGVYVLDPETKTLTGSTTTTLSGTIAHIHTGAIGVAAGVTIPFTGGPLTWTTPPTVLTDAQLTSLQTGNFYANVHSAAFPGGELRGQVYQAARTANLTGAQEVPANSSTASASGSLVVNPFTKEVAGRIETTGIAGTLAHAHQAANGVAGGVVIPMTQAGTTGVWTTAPTATVTDALLLSFIKGELYLNVHSVAFPQGEIRGQLITGQ